jgi:hypothetical protein
MNDRHAKIAKIEMKSEIIVISDYLRLVPNAELTSGG